MPEKLGSGPKVNYDSRVGAGLTRGPNRKKTRNAAPWSGTWPAPGATLDLDFANDRGFVRGVGQGRSMDAVTFTRASSANWVDSTGVLRTGAGTFTGTANATSANIIVNPQNFENATWTKTRAAITTNTLVAPDGTLTASKLTENTDSAEHYVERQMALSAVQYTGSVYAKAGERTFVALGEVTTSNKAYFDLVNGTVGNVSAGYSASISSIGDGWYRCSITWTSGGGNPRGMFIMLASVNGTTSYQGDGTSGIFIWGAQLETGSSATTYYPTNINVPRFDWASTAQRPQNLLLRTEEFNNSYWTKTGSSISADTVDTTDPFGGNNADAFIENSASSAHAVEINGGIVVESRVYSISIYAKYKNRVFQIATTLSGSNQYANFDLQNGVLGTVSSGITAAISSVGNGWYRCSVLVTASAGTRNFYPVTVTATTSGYIASYLGNGTDGVYLFGAQIETGNTVTTYVANGAYSATNTPLAANTTCNGLLIEESRTNRLLWCRDATNAAWTKTNVTAAKDQTGIDGVSSAASSLTASADAGTCINTVTLASGSRTGSVYLKRITGTGNVQVSIDGSTWSTVDLSSTEWRRIVLSGTVTNPTIGIRLATNGDAVAMDYGQIEDGAFATSPILTTTATVTRSQETASMGGANFDSWYKNGFGTVYSEFFLPPTGQAIFSLSAQDNANYSGAYRDGATTIRAITVGLGNASINPTVPISQTLLYKMAYRLQTQNMEVVFNQAYSGSLSNARLPTTYKLLYIGSYYNNSSTLDNCIKRFVYTPQILSGAALQAITS